MGRVDQVRTVRPLRLENYGEFPRLSTSAAKELCCDNFLRLNALRPHY